MTLLSSHSSKRAFSLIEAAIVLGIIGLVIGGIYVALVSVRNNQKMSDTVSGVLTLASNIKKKFPPYSYPATGGYDINIATRMKIGPENWADNANYRYLSPYGGAVSLMLYAADSSPDPGVGAVQTFRIALDFPNAGQANTFIRKMQNQAQKYGMVYAFCTQTGVQSPIDWAALTTSNATPQCVDYSNGVSVRVFFLP